MLRHSQKPVPSAISHSPLSRTGLLRLTSWCPIVTLACRLSLRGLHHVPNGDAPSGPRALHLREVHPQPLGLLPGGIRSVRLLLRSNQLTGDTRPNAYVLIRNALPNLLRQILTLFNRHGVTFGMSREPNFCLWLLLKA